MEGFTIDKSIILIGENKETTKIIGGRIFTIAVKACNVKILGFTMGVGSLAAIIGPTLAGWVFDTLGSYRLLWFGYIGLSIIAILLISHIRPLKA